MSFNIISELSRGGTSLGRHRAGSDSLSHANEGQHCVLRTLCGQSGRAILLLLLFGAVAWAQSNLATINGTVNDPQGGVIPGAAVTARNVATGVSTKTVANGSGFYSILNLPVGTYTLTVEQSGFRQYVRSGIALSTGETLGLNVRMELGAVTQSVQVTSRQSLVQTRTSDISQVMTSSSVEALPLLNRRPLQLVGLTGASVFVQYNNIIGNAVPQFSLAGGRAQDQMAWLDGADVQNVRMGVGQINMDPPAQAIQEVKVLQNTYSAQYGGSAGGVIIETSKSGTNQFHGSLSEYFRNDALDAAGFFAPIRNGSKLKPELRWNLFGGTLGGPIRKDKTFFFFSYEGGRLRQGATSHLTVPTLLQRTGDFSQTYNSKGQLIKIYDPSTTQLVNGNYVRTQFPGNVIPTGQIDAVAQKLMSYYPLPNQAPSNLAGANNFGGNYVQGTSGNAYMIKLDHTISDKDRLTGWYISDDTTPQNTSVYPLKAGDPTNFAPSKLHYGYASWFHLFGPTQVNDVTFTYTYRLYHNMSWGLGGNYPSKLGLQGVPDTAFPAFVVAGFSQLGASQAERRQFPIQSETVMDNFSWIRGRHSLKFGFQETRSGNNDVLLNSVSGNFGFSTLPTGLPGNSATGDALASLLVGFPLSFSENATEPLNRRMWYLAGFAQDDWTVNSSLTLNLGLRWETDTAIFDLNNRMNSFDPTQINPVSGTPGVVKFVGLNGWPSKPYGTRWDNFGPRVGFAWKPFNTDTTVVRGGYGIFYDHPFNSGAPTNTASLGFSTSADIASPDHGITAPFYLQNGVPVTATAPTLSDSFGAVPVGTNPNTAVSFFEPNRPAGTSQQFNLGVQHELGNGLMLEVTALGNMSKHLASSDLSLNQISPAVLGPTTDTQQYRPFPQFNNVSVILPPLAISNYYAGLVRIEKRFGQGLSFNAAYTYSKFLTNSDSGGQLGASTGYSNFYNRRADYGPSGNDITHHLVFDWVYQLPFGSGKQWLANSPLRFVAGGWTLGNVTSIQSGAPFTVTAQTNTTNTFSAGGLRPDLTGNPTLSSGRTVQKWFNTAAFAQPAAFQFGNAGVGIVRGPGLVSFDFSLLRDFKLTERAKLQFRGEFFNAFNHTNLGLPGRSFGSSSFGVINSSGPGRVVQLGAEITF